MPLTLRQVRTAIVLWLVACSVFAAASIALGLGVAGAPGPGPDVVELLEAHPDLPPEVAVSRSMSNGAATGGGAFVASLGVASAGLLWLGGMVPLAIAYLVVRRRREPEEEVQPLPRRLPRRTAPERDHSTPLHEGPGATDGPAPPHAA